VTDEKIVSLHAGYSNEGRMVDAFLSRPQTRGPHPAVVVISGMGGLNWFQREITRSFARAGFVSLAPDLFDGYQAPDHATQLLAKNSLDVDRTVGNLAAGTEYLRALPWVDTTAPVGVIGFCLGGGLALYCLGRTSAFGAGVIYYHSMFPDPSELEGIQAKMLCHYGTLDKSTPREEVEAFRETLDGYGKEFEIVYHEGVGHAFLSPNQDTSAIRANAAAASLEQSFAFLHAELGGRQTATSKASRKAASSEADQVTAEKSG
jgi:carboxymethylenebutenolidase